MSRWWVSLTILPFLLPAIWRLAHNGLDETAGLFSDLGMGLTLLGLIVLLPRWARLVVLALWVLFQAVAAELFAAVGRFPSWQDLQYMADPQFFTSSASGLHLAEPVYTVLLIGASLLVVFVPRVRPGVGTLVLTVVAGIGLLSLSTAVATTAGQSVAARYNPLHWFVADALFHSRAGQISGVTEADLPNGLKSIDLEGRNLLGERRAENVLIIAMEGISGIYHPEVRAAMGVAPGPFQMEKLAAATRDAMLVPDFVAHSHQTIRGLYALHCGDFSKLSFETPKGMELQLNPGRAAQCLPARLAAEGWTTHYLQGARLQFMNKDRIMPAMGFGEVHGLEWFDQRELENFAWGTTDPDFFSGAADYVRALQRQDRPWLLSLLTVATHQPFDAPEELVKKYGDRKIAAVARLDGAVADFLETLRQEGVLDSTLVIVTSDESHGYAGADWYTSWGTMMVLAPGDAPLPRLKEGTFGLVDVEVSVLDYLRQSVPAGVVGRSFFRDYDQAREMVSYTSGKVRWQTADERLYECSVDSSCTSSAPAGILGPNRAAAQSGSKDDASRLFGLAALLDHKLTDGMNEQRLQFGNGEIRALPARLRSEWADNLVGAQYLDFPRNSTVDVDIRIKAVTAPRDGIQLKLILRQFEHEVGTIEHPPFPLLREGETGTVRFSFTNPEPRRAFSFHLVGEGEGKVIQLEKFEVAINRHAGVAASGGAGY